MVVVAAEEVDEFGPGPMKGSVLRFLKENRLRAVWEGKLHLCSNARSLTKEMQYPLPHIPNIIQDSISVKCIRVENVKALLEVRCTYQ
ncbi:hypothetical protein CMV_015704 [Castanea mollissima]|uniref:Uncharacterized protein n=1 Tax=Castanea mollissima TaxID=60419 RepID=A0A8J4R9M1_9ROSI|nr:hypothetical protein CMV_015704 [Castanea mollissima]